MLSRAMIIAPVARRALFKSAPSVTAAVKRFDHHGPPADYKYPTMDDMLVPCGCWQEDYDCKQRKYNLHLLLGAGFLLISLAVGKYSGAFNFYFYWPNPADRSQLELSCE